MHAARNSDRLRRVAGVLSSATRPLSTRELAEAAQVCALSAVISELRQRGCAIICDRRGHHYYYWMTECPPILGGAS